MPAEFEDVEAIAETDKALLCRINGEEVWVPQSQIDEDSEVYTKGDRGTLIVTEWWAAQRRLI